MNKDKGVAASPPGHSDEPASSLAANAGSVPNAVWTTAATVAGHLAMWAVRQSPYACPDALPDALAQFSKAFPADGNGLSQWVDEDHLYGAVWCAIEASPAILAWNRPKSGHDAQVVFSSRYDKPSPDDDFIDLYALAGNMSRSVWLEERHAQGDESPVGDSRCAPGEQP